MRHCQQHRRRGGDNNYDDDEPPPVVSPDELMPLWRRPPNESHSDYTINVKTTTSVSVDDNNGDNTKIPTWRRRQQCLLQDAAAVSKPSVDISDVAAYAVNDKDNKKDEEEAKCAPFTTYHVHKAVLATGKRKCDYFGRMLQHSCFFAEGQTNTSQLELQEPAAKAFPAFLDYLYLPEQPLRINSSTATALHHLGCYLDNDFLRYDSKEFIRSNLQRNNMHIYYEHAVKLFKDDVVYQLVVRCCANHLFELIVDDQDEDDDSEDPIVKLANLEFWKNVLDHHRSKQLLAADHQSYAIPAAAAAPNSAQQNLHVCRILVRAFDCNKQESDKEAKWFAKLVDPEYLPEIDPDSAFLLLKLAKHYLSSSPSSLDGSSSAVVVDDTRLTDDSTTTTIGAASQLATSAAADSPNENSNKAAHSGAPAEQPNESSTTRQLGADTAALSAPGVSVPSAAGGAGVPLAAASLTADKFDAGGGAVAAVVAGKRDDDETKDRLRTSLESRCLQALAENWRELGGGSSPTAATTTTDDSFSFYNKADNDYWKHHPDQLLTLLHNVVDRAKEQAITEPNGGPPKVLVTGCGIPQANGVYRQAGFFQGGCLYVMDGYWVGKPAPPPATEAPSPSASPRGLGGPWTRVPSAPVPAAAPPVNNGRRIVRASRPRSCSVGGSTRAAASPRAAAVEPQIHKYVIMHCPNLDGDDQWWLSFIPPGKQMGTSTDVDLYYATFLWSSTSGPRIPPRTGWCLASSGNGALPLPIISYCNDQGGLLSTGGATSFAAASPRRRRVVAPAPAAATHAEQR